MSTSYDKRDAGGKARSHEAGAGTASRPMTGLNAGSIPAPRLTRAQRRQLAKACAPFDVDHVLFAFGGEL